MKNYAYIFTSIILFMSCSNNTPTEHPKVDKKMLLHHIKAISHDSMQGRFFGTEGNYKTQKFISKQFDSLGIEPAFASGSIQKFPYTFKGKRRQRIYPVANAKKDFSNVADTTVFGGNVVTMIKGKSEKAIVITGHLDHLGIRKGKIYNGADDDASGTAALFSIANYFKNKSPKHTLYFAAVDAEEIGSLGCDYLLNNFPTSTGNIVLNINMDMISRNDSLEIYASGLHHYPQLAKPLKDIKSKNISLLFGHDDSENKKKDDWTYSSDHRIFHAKNIPFIYFGVEDHKDYHKATDTYENIHQEFYVNAVELIIEAIENYDVFLTKDKK